MVDTFVWQAKRLQMGGNNGTVSPSRCGIDIDHNLFSKTCIRSPPPPRKKKKDNLQTTFKYFYDIDTAPHLVFYFQKEEKVERLPYFEKRVE